LHAAVDLTGGYFLDNVDVGGVTWKRDHSKNSLQFLVALLNSRVLRWFFPQVSAPFRGGFRSANRQFLGQLPVPGATDQQQALVARIVDCILWINRQPTIVLQHHDAALAGFLELIVNGLVYELFFPEELHKAGLQLFRLVEEAQLPILDAIPEGERLATLRIIGERINNTKHPLLVVTASSAYCQPWVSPVWYTALASLALQETLDLGDGKNLLLYGENGAGKSSLFRALREMFNHTSLEPFSVHKNIFTVRTRTDGYVKLHFSAPAATGAPNSPAEWPFPGPRPTADPRIVQGALRLGSLDYRSLLDTNYVFKGGEVNLFDVLANGVLRPWLIDVPGRGLVRLGTLWDGALAKRTPTPREQREAFRARGGGGRRRVKLQTHGKIIAANAAAAVFSTALRSNLRRITLRGNRMLRRLGLRRLAFTLNADAVGYNEISRAFVPQRIAIRVSLHGTEIEKPQQFLNEARLSAIALALYFAALIEVVPNDPAWPRVLVLDDVLIGLDMDNRLPVLDILRNEFRDWQVVLLTHDRTWYEVAQIATQPDDRWLSFEMYARPRQEDNLVYDVPWLRPPVGNPKQLKSVADNHIAQARAFLAINDDRTAAFHARVVLESKLK
jgi:energy-coupling factor transporter ATP-binding protein EcfA2